MDAKQVREWKAGYDAMNAFVLEERRTATYQERFKALVAIWNLARGLRSHLRPKQGDLKVAEAWQTLRARYAERNA
jgi:hypothetical protein